ncbi:hypothetical protein DQ010_17785, partial [Salmonella enterica subsp. enterica serovar Oranienburg]|nr:hypothetical protein [Salmonella enterica subsp. enterica serovar Oranienburg]
MRKNLSSGKGTPRVTVVRMRQMRPDSIPGSTTGAGNIIITERIHIKMTWLRLNLSEVVRKDEDL